MTKLHLSFLSRFLVLAGLGFLVSCTAAHGPWVKVVDTEEMTWIVQKVAADWKHNQGQRLRLEHSQVHYTNKFTTLSLEFSSQEILEVEQARNLLVDLTEQLLREINTNPIVGGELASTFTADNLSIEINFESYLGEYVDPFYVGCAKLHHGFAYYYAFDLKDENRYSWHSRVEPYFKTREVSMLSRAAEKLWDEVNDCPKHRLLDELYVPEDGEVIPPKCRAKRQI